MKKNTLLLVLLISSCLQAQTIFDWESNAARTGFGVVEHTKDGITVTASLPDRSVVLNTNFSLYYDGAYPGTGWENMVGTILFPESIGLFNGLNGDLTVTFSEPVTLNKFYAGNVIESPAGLFNVTFSTTDGTGNNDVVLVYDNVTMHEVVLNWTNVTSFTVNSVRVSGTALRVKLVIDNMLVNAPLLSTEEVSALDNDFILYPNPVENILHAKTNTKVNSIKVFNSLGKMLLETNNKAIDFNSFSQGIYFVQINSDFGSKTKRVVKR